MISQTFPFKMTTMLYLLIKATKQRLIHSFSVPLVELSNNICILDISFGANWA